MEIFSFYGIMNLYSYAIIFCHDTLTNVVGIGYDDKKAEAFIAAFQKYLDDFNANSELPYLVRASVGYYLMPIDGTDSLEHCINAADASLYEFKRKKKEQKLDNVIRVNE